MGNLKYISEKYGISLNFPKNWKGQFMIFEPAFFGNNLDYFLIQISDKNIWMKGNNSGVLFTLYVFPSKESYNTFSRLGEDSKGIKVINAMGPRVVLYTLPSDEVYKTEEEASKNNYLDMASKVDSILKTLKVTN